MGIKSKRKGKAGERQVKDRFRKALVGILDDVDVVRRNHQQAEVGGADLVGVPVFSVEVKRVRRLPLTTETRRFQNWWRQCCVAAEVKGKEPCLVYREDRGEWHVAAIVEGEFTIMTWEEFEPLMKKRVVMSMEVENVVVTGDTSGD